MLLAVPKTKTKLYGDCLLPEPLAFGMHVRYTLRILNHSISLRVKLEDSCSASAIEYKDHIIAEYRDYYCHYYYYYYYYYV